MKKEKTVYKTAPLVLLRNQNWIKNRYILTPNSLYSVVPIHTCIFRTISCDYFRSVEPCSLCSGAACLWLLLTHECCATKLIRPIKLQRRLWHYDSTRMRQSAWLAARRLVQTSQVPKTHPHESRAYQQRATWLDEVFCIPWPWAGCSNRAQRATLECACAMVRSFT